HVALQRDVAAQQMRLYVDGTVVVNQTLTVTGTIKDDDGEADPLTIGAVIQNSVNGCGCPMQFFTGTIDEVGYYNRALSASEIRGNFAAGSLHRQQTGEMTISPGANTTPAPVTVQAQVGDNFYSPPNITINVGDSVQWTWAGGNPHSVTSD